MDKSNIGDAGISNIGNTGTPNIRNKGISNIAHIGISNIGKTEVSNWQNGDRILGKQKYNIGNTGHPILGT